MSSTMKQMRFPCPTRGSMPWLIVFATFLASSDLRAQTTKWIAPPGSADWFTPTTGIMAFRAYPPRQRLRMAVPPQSTVHSLKSVPSRSEPLTVLVQERLRSPVGDLEVSWRCLLAYIATERHNQRVPGSPKFTARPSLCSANT
jgi:hypothetical protein